jgi:hypothetical protein
MVEGGDIQLEVLCKDLLWNMGEEVYHLEGVNSSHRRRTMRRDELNSKCIVGAGMSIGKYLRAAHS